MKVRKPEDAGPSSPPLIGYYNILDESTVNADTQKWSAKMFLSADSLKLPDADDSLDP